ncbi:MAG: DUF4936 family protein [Gammaproteobacteria bacterium]|nr:MAG: DUF4936 family protein [Gammaproteobacteria bacterium]
MTTHFYVWYRIEGDAAECERAVRGMMARLTCRTGVAGQLLQKCDEARLWMEVYADVAEPEAFSHRLRQAVDEYDIEMFIDGPRHTECFRGEPLPIPACGASAAPTP